MTENEVKKLAWEHANHIVQSNPCWWGSIPPAEAISSISDTIESAILLAISKVTKGGKP